MIVYELITLRRGTHLPAGKAFESSYCAGAFVECRVLDNGSAPGKRPAGRGLKIVYELTKGLGGRFRAEFWNGRINFYLNVSARWGNGKNRFSTKGPTRRRAGDTMSFQPRLLFLRSVHVERYFRLLSPGLLAWTRHPRRV